MQQTIALEPKTAQWPRTDGAITEWASGKLKTIDLQLAAHAHAAVQGSTDLGAEVFLLAEDDKFGDSTILQLSAGEARMLAAHLLKVADFVEAAQR